MDLRRAAAARMEAAWQGSLRRVRDGRMSDFDFRFGGIARLYGKAGLERLRAAHVTVIGIGGVGSWVVEALARSGVGAITLVDLDEACVSNINRQLHALDGAVGRSKAGLMADRVQAINPGCGITAVLEFFNEENGRRLLGLEKEFEKARPTFVIDAIDNVANKVRLLALCHANGIPIITCGGAGGRRDATQVRIGDLARVTHDRLLSEVRKRLRQEHGFPRGEKKFGIEAVFSAEPQVFPQQDGSVCEMRAAAPEGESLRLNCDWGFGSATCVTGTFGFAAAGLAVRRIAESQPTT
jgi:tRNA A37 threonylcarbamoyladenosine dehydratase